MEVLTLREIMTRAGVKERTARSWVAKVKEEGSYTVRDKWVMEATGRKNDKREVLYSWKAIGEPDAPVVEEKEAKAGVLGKKVGEREEPREELPFNELNDLRNKGEATPRQLDLWRQAVVDGGYAGYRTDPATKRMVLDSPYEWILVPGRLAAERADLEQRLNDLADREAKLAKIPEGMEKRERESEQKEAELEQVKVDMQKVDLVKKWAGDTLNVLLNSKVWKDAYYEEGSELPEWPTTISEEEIASWAELPQPAKKRPKRVKKQAVDEGMFDAEE